MTNKLDEIFKRVLNDEDIFYIKREIFNEQEWNDLKAKKDTNEKLEIIEKKLEALKIEKNTTPNRNRQELENCINLCENLKKKLDEAPNIISQLFTTFKRYGIVHCNLPNMDDYGKIIERQSIPIVKQFFLDKIKRESNLNRKKALTKVLEYVEELHRANVAIEEIAYFVRKLDSLTSLWEV